MTAAEFWKEWFNTKNTNWLPLDYTSALINPRDVQEFAEAYPRTPGEHGDDIEILRKAIVYLERYKD